MRIIKSVYQGSSKYQTNLEDGMGSLMVDLEEYSSQVMKGLHLPGSSTQLRGSLRNAVRGLRNVDFDLYERLISFGRTLRILVDSRRGMNKELVHSIELPMKSLVQTYFHIAYRTSHKEITETAAGLVRDVSDDPNQVSFLPGY